MIVSTARLAKTFPLNLHAHNSLNVVMGPLMEGF